MKTVDAFTFRKLILSVIEFMTIHGQGWLARLCEARAGDHMLRFPPWCWLIIGRVSYACPNPALIPGHRAKKVVFVGELTSQLVEFLCGR